VVAPLVWRSRMRSRLLLLAFVGGVILDVDHALAAGTLSPGAMEELGRRPPTHSLAFAATLALIAYACTRRVLAAWAVLAIMGSHLLFDAAGGGVRWLYPLPEPESIPWLACPLGILLLFGVSLALTRSQAPPLAGSPAGSAIDAHPVDEHARRELGGRIG
jgi:membrane-bound metal-dependent hydrolase YbcI (DUF457 family)